MSSNQFVFVLLSVIVCFGTAQKGDKRDCPDEIDEMLVKYRDLQELYEYCSDKHQFYCIDYDGLLCTILNLNFDCDADEKIFCPNPMQAVKGVIDRFHEEYRFDRVAIKSNGGNGSLALPSDFLDSLKRSFLKVLSLENLNLTSVPPFQKLESLKKITISGNSIDFLETHAFFELPHLISLDLRSNKIQQLATETFAKLDRLDDLILSDNLLKVIPNRAFVDMPSLKTLSISENQLHSIDPNALSEITSLVNLDLSSNAFESKPDLQALENLEFLALNQNQIKKIQCDWMYPGDQPYQKLEILELNDNQISEIACDLNLKLPALYSIVLNRNQLTSLSERSFFNFLSSNNARINKMVAIKGTFFFWF